MDESEEEAREMAAAAAEPKPAPRSPSHYLGRAAGTAKHYLPQQAGEAVDKLTAAANKAGRKVTGARDKASDTVLMAQSRTQQILDKVQSGIDDLALGAGGGGKRKTSLTVGASFCAASDETALLELDQNPPQRPLTPQYLQVLLFP